MKSTRRLFIVAMQKAFLTAMPLLWGTAVKAQVAEVAPMPVSTIVAGSFNRAGQRVDSPVSARQTGFDSPQKVKQTGEGETMPEPYVNGGDYHGRRGTEIRYADMPAYARSLPEAAIRTNLLYGIGTFTPNLGVEVGLAPHSTLLIAGSYNGWNLDRENKNRMLCHWLASMEYRYWFCERFNGHFIGAHGYYADYHIKGYGIPLMFEKGAADYRYKGNVYGAGISYGYQLLLGARWNLEFNAGAGFGVTEYDKYNCDRCSDRIGKSVSRVFFAPTKLGISLTYIIKSRK